MPIDTYPKSIGAMLWLHFMLLLDADPKAGNVVTTIDEIHEKSYVPKAIIEPTLDKLVRHRLIKIEQLNTKYVLITLSHFVLVH